MSAHDIVCSRCGKTASITADEGKLCIDCWRARRAENRKIREDDSLNTCFSYKTKAKVTKKEAEIINSVMEELEKKGL